MALPTSKIEDRAITALRNIIDGHPTMRHSFNSMDTEMAWDGYLWIYKDNAAGQSKKNFDDKIPVQIKGHIDAKEEYLNKTRITFPVSIEDLQIYFNDRGVIYFQIFMTEDNKKCEVFYSSLFPSKIKSYLDRTKVQQKNMSITFTKLEKTPNDIYSKAKQFSIESRKQGFGLGQIVQATIPLKDMDKITSISANLVGATSEYDLLKSFSCGDFSLYGTINGCPFKLPLEWSENQKISLRKIVKEPISVEGINYYEQFMIERNSDGENILLLSKNLQINLTQQKFSFIPKSNIKQIRNDADFMFAIQKSGNFSLFDQIVMCNNTEFSREMANFLRGYIDLDNTLSMIDLNYDRPFNEIPENVLNQLFMLVEIRKGNRNNSLPDKICKCNWKIEDKYLPLIIFREENKVTNTLVNIVYSKKYRLFVSNDKDENFKVPVLAYISPDILSDLYYFDYESLYNQIDTEDINEYTVDILNLYALNLITAYDLSKNDEFLELAIYQLEKIKDVLDWQDYYIINKLQIRKRQGKFKENDIALLNEIKTSNAMASCGINTLLDNKEKAKYFYSKMEENEQRDFEDYPIYYLYRKMVTESDK